MSDRIEDEIVDEIVEPVDPVEPVEAITDEPVELEQPEPVREWSDEDEEEAMAFGWKPADKWKGEKPKGYIDDPRRFMERAENFRPFKALKERLDKQETEAEARIRKLEAVSKVAIDAQKAQYERTIAEITQQQVDAINDADGDRWKELEDKKATLKPVEVPEEAPKTNAPDPFVQKYAETPEGAWVNNPIVREAGIKLINAKGMNNSNSTVEEQIKYAEAEVRKMYPAFFPAASASTPKPKQKVDGGGLGGGNNNAAGGFSQLPSEAKQAFKSFVEQGIFKDDNADRKRYTDEYNAA